MNRKRILENNKKMLYVSIALVVVILILITLGLISKSNLDKEKKLSRLSEQYTDSLKQSNGLKGADYYLRDENGDVLYESKGKYEMSVEDKKDEDKLKRKADILGNDVTQYVNKKDFKSLYSLFNADYIEDFDYTLDKCTRAFTFDKDISYEITNVKKEGDRFIITAKFKIDNSIKFVDFTLFSDGSIADIPIKVSANINKTKTYEDVTYTVLKRFDTRLGSIYSIEIDNKSDKLIHIDSMYIRNGSTVCTYEIVSDNTVLEAYPNNPLKFMIKLPNAQTITNLTLRYKDINGEEKEVDIYSK